jgi:predicted  nucleic acid-binding Zn-ribbon protein
LFQQANEREQWKSQFGENHELYQAGVRIQHAEFTETLLNQFKAMRDELLAQQKQAEQERIEDEMKALQDRVKAEQDEINARLKALQEEINAKQKEISEAEKLADKFRRLAKNLEEYRRNLWTGENNLTGSRYNEAYSQFNDLYQKALTGDEDAFSQLTGKAGELLQLGRDQLPERGEYNDLFYDVDQKLKRAQLYAEQQVSQAERELEILNAQLEAMQKEQEDLNLRLDALQAELQAQQEVLQAQLDAINRNTEETSKIPYTLEQLNSAISYLSGALNTQVGGDSHAGGKTDWERLIAEKVWQLNAGAYQGRTNWTREDFIKAAKESFGSVERWYELAGRQEGFTLKAAQTTNDTLDRNSKTTLKTLNDYNLATNGYLNSQLTEAYAQGANLSSLLYTQEGYWPQAVSGISGLNSGLSSVYSGVIGLNSGLSSIYSGVTGLNGGLSSIYNAVVALGEGGGGSYGGSTGSWGGSSGGNYNGSGPASARNTTRCRQAREYTDRATRPRTRF